jgi:hypothetical protein
MRRGQEFYLDLEACNELGFSDTEKIIIETLARGIFGSRQIQADLEWPSHNMVHRAKETIEKKLREQDFEIKKKRKGRNAAFSEIQYALIVAGVIGVRRKRRPRSTRS